jgi:transposase
MYYIGLDVHKRKINYCVKDSGGKIYAEGSLPATRVDLDLWMKRLPHPRSGAMEATMFSGWIYDQLKPHAAALKVAHPLMLRAIAAAKKKNDRIDASKICDCLRCYRTSGIPARHLMSDNRVMRPNAQITRYRSPAQNCMLIQNHEHSLHVISCGTRPSPSCARRNSVEAVRAEPRL